MNGHTGDLPTKGMGPGGCSDQKVDPGTTESLRRLTERKWRELERTNRIARLADKMGELLRFKER